MKTRWRKRGKNKEKEKDKEEEEEKKKPLLDKNILSFCSRVFAFIVH